MYLQISGWGCGISSKKKCPWYECINGVYMCTNNIHMYLQTQICTCICKHRAGVVGTKEPYVFAKRALYHHKELYISTNTHMCRPRYSAKDQYVTTKERISPQKSPVLPHESPIPQHKSACVGRAARAYSYVLRKRALRHYTRA